MATDSVTTDIAQPHVIEAVAPPRYAASADRIAAAWQSPTMRRGVLAVIDQGITSGTSFVTSVIIGRACSQAELGVYYLALSIVLFARAVQGDAISAPYMVYCSRRRGQALAAYSGSTLIHQILLTALTMVGLLALAAMLGLGIGSESLLPVVWPLLGAVPFLLLREYLRSVSFAHLQIGAAMALDIAVAVLQLGGLLALTHFGALTVERVYLLMGGCCAAACLGWFWSKRQPLEFRRERIAADWRDNWSFARWTLAGQSLSRTSGFLIPWIVAAVHGEAATGVLAACITVVNLAGTFVTGVSNLLTPEASHTYVRGGARALGRLLWQIALLFILTVGGFALAMLMMGNWLAVFVFGDKFAGTGPILTLLAFSMFINSLGLTVGNGLWALDMPKANFRADLCVLVVTMLLVACLIYPLGVLGAAIAILGGTATGALMRAWILQRQLKNVA